MVLETLWKPRMQHDLPSTSSLSSARKHPPSSPLTPTPAPATKRLYSDTGVTALSTDISDQFCPSAAYSWSIDLTRDEVAVYFFDTVCSISISSTVLICNLQSSAPPNNSLPATLTMARLHWKMLAFLWFQQAPLYNMSTCLDICHSHAAVTLNSVWFHLMPSFWGHQLYL